MDRKTGILGGVEKKEEEEDKRGWRRKFSICVKAEVIDPFGAAAPKHRKCKKKLKLYVTKRPTN